MGVLTVLQRFMKSRRSIVFEITLEPRGHCSNPTHVDGTTQLVDVGTAHEPDIQFRL